MNDQVYYSIYDTGIRKDKVKQYKVVNLTSATEAAFTWESSHKKSKPTHGANVLHAVINRLGNLEGRINKDWVKKIISDKLVFVDSQPGSFMPFGLPGEKYASYQWVFQKHSIPNTPYLKKLEQKDAMVGRWDAHDKTLSYQYLTSFTNISRSFGATYTNYLDRKWSDRVSKSINGNFTGPKQSRLITAASGNKPKTSVAYDAIHNNRHVTTVSVYDMDYGTAGPNVFASDRGTFYSSVSKDYITGTSFASPQVSAVGILVDQINSNFNWRNHQDFIANGVSLTKRDTGLFSTLSDLNLLDYSPVVTGGTNWNGGGRLHTHKFGFGFVDPEAQLLLAASAQPDNAKEKKIVKQISLPVTDHWSTTIDIKENIQVEHILFDLKAVKQKTEDISLSIQSPSGVVYPILKPHDNGKKTKLDFFFLSVAVRGELSEGKWTLVGKGPVGSSWEAGRVGVSFYGTPVAKSQDIVYTNDIASSTLQEIDKKNGKTFENRLVLNNAVGEKRINCAAIYPNDLGDGTVKIDLNPGTVSNINGQLVKIDPKSKPINAAYGGGSHDIIIGNQSSNTLVGGPGDDYLDGGDGEDRYEISTYPFYNMSNHDIIDVTAGDKIVRKDASISEMLFYETEQGQLFGVLGSYNAKMNTLQLSQNDSVCINLAKTSPKELLLKDSQKEYSLVSWDISYDQNGKRHKSKVWLPKATSGKPALLWLPQNAKNVRIDSLKRTLEDATKANICIAKFVQHKLTGTLSPSSQKMAYQTLFDNLLINHGVKVSEKVSDPKINKENRHWIGKKSKIYLNLDQDPDALASTRKIALKDVLQPFAKKAITSVVIGNPGETGADIHNDTWVDFNDAEEKTFSGDKWQNITLNVEKEVKNLPITIHFDQTKSVQLTVNGSRKESVDAASYEGYVYQQPALINGQVMKSEQNHQGYYHVHVKLVKKLPYIFAIKGIPLEKIVKDAGLDQIFTVKNTTLNITKLSDVVGGGAHLYKDYHSVMGYSYFKKLPKGPHLNIKKGKEVTLEAKNPAILFSRSRIQEKYCPLGHILKISNQSGDKHLIVTSSVGLKIKPKPFDLKGFLTTSGLVK